MPFRRLLAIMCCFMALNVAMPTLANAESLEVVKPADTTQGKFVQTLGDMAVAALKDKSLDAAGRREKFRELFRTHFDLSTIGRFVIGRSWNAATPEQQEQYRKLFEELVVQTYSEQFSLYAGEGFQVTAVRPEGERDFIVNSLITHPDGSPSTQVDWRIREKDGRQGIIDVIVEGISMSVTQRQEYSSVIQRNGGNIEGLLNLMRKRLADHAAQAEEKKG